MKGSPTTGINSMIYYRLIALWVICEAMLGGIIHGFKIPVSGLVVGTCAVICICLIAWYVPIRGAILRATLVVAIFKMMLSPQAPFTAYVAVFFQGLSGELLFWNRRWYRISCFIFALLALLESGLQRILVVTILYGDDIWKAINEFLNRLTKQKTVSNYSFWIGAIYVAFHVIAGILAGWCAAVLPSRINKWSKDRSNKLSIEEQTTISTQPLISAKRKRRRLFLIIIWIALVLLLIQSEFSIGEPILPAKLPLRMLVRSMIILFTWYFIVGPLLKKLLHGWLQRKKTTSQSTIQQVSEVLPSMQRIVTQSWKYTRGKKGINRMMHTGKLILVNALGESQVPVYLLSGAIKTGKTSWLIGWNRCKKDVWGILTPVIDGKRMFMDAHTKELFSMEAAANEAAVLKVGRYSFSQKNFEKAIDIIRHASTMPGWLVIDEIGPLELKGKGFSVALKEILATRGAGNLLLVVREGLEMDVKDYFQIKEWKILLRDDSACL